MRLRAISPPAGSPTLVTRPAPLSVVLDIAEECERVRLGAALRAFGFDVCASGSAPADAIPIVDADGMSLEDALGPARGEPRAAIVLSGDRETRLAAVRRGIADVLAKPVDPSERCLRVVRVGRQQRQQARLEAERRMLHEVQHMKDELAALLVHDLRSPVGTVLANVELAREALTDPPLADAALEDAGASCRRALRLLGNLLDVARSESGRLVARRQRRPVAALFEQALVDTWIRLRGRPVAVRVEVPEDLEVNADPELMLRAVQNVLDNATRYVPDDGEIVLSARRDGAAVELRIGNSGPAIPRAQRHRIFAKFERAVDGSRRNLGLGLYFCRIAAAAHDGRVTVEEGRLPTEFVFRLPDR